ncbi:hypothetical protein Syun_027967 [Stephania yunnanensis]|uniref:Uncharacterized protein n=1 Tax=Stephania yunnanensis TaxID=152371 RepID=A0AAP0EGI7_9MAGN
MTSFRQKDTLIDVVNGDVGFLPTTTNAKIGHYLLGFVAAICERNLLLSMTAETLMVECRDRHYKFDVKNRLLYKRSAFYKNLVKKLKIGITPWQRSEHKAKPPKNRWTKCD